MEVKDMDSIYQSVQNHEKRIETLEKGNAEIVRQISDINNEVKSMKSSFIDVKNTVREEGDKSRQANEKLIDRFDRSNERLWTFIEKNEGYEDAAAERIEVTKRTKLQVFKDVLVAILAAIGSAIGAPIAWGEIARLIHG